ncbi:MAG: sigma 54-interacting transcriptional regulator [Myxococcales bacterium]|nr:sigma 54-interacting transcriptional regulator [Myxococcales bacterium]
MPDRDRALPPVDLPTTVPSIARYYRANGGYVPPLVISFGGAGACAHALSLTTRGRVSPESEEPTAIESNPGTGARERMCLLVIGDGLVSTVPLPSSGDLVIGRSEEADIKVEGSGVSRRHARLHVGSELRVEDLGSTNGTFVNYERLERGSAARLAPGWMFELGSTMFILQGGHHALHSRRLWTHVDFEVRLAEECARAGRCGAQFVLARVRVTDRRGTRAPLHDVVLGCMRPGDVLGACAADDFEALVLDASFDEAREIVERVTSRLRAMGVEVRSSLASYPDDGRAPAALMTHAGAEVERSSKRDASKRDASTSIVVASASMERLYELVERVSTSEVNVLLLGETGVGKEIFAERIHAWSPRARGPLVRLNCAALPEALLESELFGHERGAFTGASAAKPGLLETAEGGTVFLDEIGDMPTSLQAKLLRVLEERSVRRVGALQSHHIDIRVVAATHKDLEREAHEGRFRQDLFFRLNGVAIMVPPLRERLEEIEPLARMFVAAACQQQGRPTLEIDAEALQALRGYAWPGNIRELRNVAERAVVLCTHTTIAREHLPDKVSGFVQSRSTKRDERVPPADPSTTALKAGIKEHERQLIMDALARTDGNQTRAAKLLGVSRRTLISRIEEYGLPRPRKK